MSFRKKNITKKQKFIYKLTFSYLFVISSFVSAEDYFDPSFLTLSGESNNIDLSIFSNKNSVAEGKYTLTVFLNNPHNPVLFCLYGLFSYFENQR